MRNVPKPKFCKYKPCNKEFINYNSVSRKYCSYSCEAKDTKDKEVDQKVKQMKENLKGHSYYIQFLQVVFNTFIRVRDKGKDCISCDSKLDDKYHAGHYLSTGAYPNLRFEETNVHGQCIRCNMHLHGALIPYTEKLPKRIGLDAYYELLEKRKQEKKYTIPEIKELIKLYRDKTKALQETNNNKLKT